MLKPESGKRFPGIASHRGVLCLLLAIATILAYSRTFQNGFVNYDDADYVTANKQVQQGLTLDGIKWAFTTGHASNWHPLTWVSHMVDVRLFGLNAAGHHATSLALHVANTLLLFWFLNVATGSKWRSAMVAALFALHPLHVESVAWASERKDVLSAFFFLLTLCFYSIHARARCSDLKAECSSSSATTPSLHAKTQRRQEEGKSANSDLEVGSSKSDGGRWTLNGRGSELNVGSYTLSLLCFALGLMSKPMLVTAPFVLLLLDYWPFKRIDLKHGFSIKQAGTLILEKLPFFLLAGASSVVTYFVQREGGAVSVALTVGQRLANAAVAYVRYLRKTVWPDDLSVLYPHPGSWPAWQVVAAAILLVTITAGVLHLAHKQWHGKEWRPLLVGWFWFLGMMVPVIGIVQVGIQSMADRYTYLPIIGLFFGIIWTIAEHRGGERSSSERPQTRGRAVRAPIAQTAFSPARSWIGLCALCVLAMLAFRQVGYWRDTETLFTRAVQVTKDNYLAYNNLGYHYSGKGKIAESMQFYEKSLRIKPDYEDALNNMGYALAKLGRHREAIPYYERALRVRPKHVEVHNNLGNALSELGEMEAAIEHYRFALSQKSDHADAHNNLAIALAMKGQFPEAISHFERTLSLNPTNAGAHSNLGNAYAIQKQFEKAIQQYEKALKLNPQDSQAHNNLGNVLMQQDRTAEALQHYEISLRLNPNNPEGHYNLGMALLRQSKSGEANEHFRRALELRPNYPDAMRRLKEIPGLHSP